MYTSLHGKGPLTFHIMNFVKWHPLHIHDLEGRADNLMLYKVSI